MTVLLDAPAAPAPLPAGPKGRGHGVAVVVAGLLVLGGVLWSFVLWAAASVELSARPASFGGTADVVTLPDYGARGTHVVDYRHGAQVELVVPLRNNGPLPVRLTAMTAGESPLPLLALTAGLPVTVAPGQTQEVVLRGVLGNCASYHERQVQNLDALQVELEVLGLPASRSVPLDRPLLVHSPMIVGCPDRTLTRNDDHRTPDLQEL